MRHVCASACTQVHVALTLGHGGLRQASRLSQTSESDVYRSSTFPLCAISTRSSIIYQCYMMNCRKDVSRRPTWTGQRVGLSVSTSVDLCDDLRTVSKDLWSFAAQSNCNKTSTTSLFIDASISSESKHVSVFTSYAPTALFLSTLVALLSTSLCFFRYEERPPIDTDRLQIHATMLFARLSSTKIELYPVKG